MNSRVYVAALTVIILWIPLAGFSASVTTHHNDNFRTGWNPQETTLTPSNVATSFGQAAVVTLDAQVDAQPLVMSNQAVNGTIHSSVVFVATENNSIYAIDGTTGAILTTVRLETPVQASSLPQSCNNNSSIIGINSTPVIDPVSGTLYVVTATLGSGMINHYLHALSTSTLSDTVAPVQITPPSSVIKWSRQRSALTLFNGGVLIPFTSFCDNDSLYTLGYLDYVTLAGTAQQAQALTSSLSLSSIWMSGGGPATSGNYIFFTTGNQTTSNNWGCYNPKYPKICNYPQSMIEMIGSSAPPPTLRIYGAVPPDTSIMYNDQDFGAGSVLIIPAGVPASITASTSPQFVAGAGKQGDLWVFTPALVGAKKYPIGGDCHCGTSYFSGADGNGHVVTSAGTTLGLYTVTASGLTPSLSAVLPSKAHGDPGVFTSISSNGTAPGTAIIWTVSGPDSSSVLSLYAFDATTLTSLYTASAGFWPYTGANANTVPVVANGHVYVASYGELTISTVH